MHITLLAVGSRGDVQPMVALGVGLRAAGHAVCLATHAQFADFVAQHNLDFYPIAGDPQLILETDAGKRWLESGSNPLRFIRGVIVLGGHFMSQLSVDCWQASQGADMIGYTTLAQFSGLHIAEKLRIPSFAGYLQPIMPTRNFPAIFFPQLPRYLPGGPPGIYNRLTHQFTLRLFWQFVREPMMRMRRDLLDLPPISMDSMFREAARARTPLLHAYSPSVLPKPPDWPDWYHVTGYWFLDSASHWTPPADLVAFLQAGPPPVYVGFGSMSTRRPAETTQLILEALARSGQRGLILTGWGGLHASDLPDNVYKIDAAPHDWLLPRMAAVVHHGGAGTTSAGLRAGVPSIVVPFFGDQGFWARRVAALGVGPAPIPREQLTVERLASAIRTAISDQAMRQRAAELGDCIRSEGGVARAVAIIERMGQEHSAA